MAIIKAVQPKFDVGDFVKVSDKLLRKQYRSNYKVFDIDIKNNTFIYKLVYDRKKHILDRWFTENELMESNAKHVLRGKLIAKEYENAQLKEIIQSMKTLLRDEDQKMFENFLEGII